MIQNNGTTNITWTQNYVSFYHPHTQNAHSLRNATFLLETEHHCVVNADDW